MANDNVKAMFPLKFALNGKKGINPKILFTQIKKNRVNKNGMYFTYFFSPILGIATSSLIKTTIGSKNLAIPLGTFFSDFLYERAMATNKSVRTSNDKNIEKTFFVIEKSKGLTLVG